MPKQAALFGEDQATIAEAIDRAERGAGEDWMDYAVGFLRRYLETHAEMHCDDLWANGLEKGDQPKALGAVIRHAVREGWMEATGEYRASRTSNYSAKPVWRSLLHGEAP